MKDAQKPDHVSLTTIIDRPREGQYVIPDFQREFEWKPWDTVEGGCERLAHRYGADGELHSCSRRGVSERLWQAS